MILHYTTEPLVRMECAALLTKYFYCQKHSDDPDEPYDIESYFGALCQRRHIPKEVIKERFSHFIPPLSALYRDMAQEAGRIPPDAASLFFDQPDSEFSSPAMALSAILEKGIRLRDIADEGVRAAVRFQIASTISDVDLKAFDEEAADYSEAALIRSLEQSGDLPETNWKALMVWRHTDEYLDRLESLLRAPAEAYRKHIPALQPLFEEAIALVKARLAQDPRRALEEHYHLLLDVDEITVRPQAAILAGATLRIMTGELDERLMMVGCCFEQLRSLADTDEEQTAALARQLKSIDDRQRLKILSALKQAPLCGQDVCALTGLSPATVSHHMNALVGNAFITIEKAGTRINYRQSPERIRSFLKELSDYLL